MEGGPGLRRPGEPGEDAIVASSTTAQQFASSNFFWLKVQKYRFEENIFIKYRFLVFRCDVVFFLKTIVIIFYRFLYFLYVIYSSLLSDSRIVC